MTNNIGFAYGPMEKTLEEQANEQGYTLGNKAELLEKIRHAINMCMFHVATESQVAAMTKKLHHNVIQVLKEE